MEQKFNKALKKLVRILLIPSAGYLMYWGGFNYLAAQNSNEHKIAMEIARDASRPGYKSYGLNYGFKTDSAVRANR